MRCWLFQAPTTSPTNICNMNNALLCSGCLRVPWIPARCILYRLMLDVSGSAWWSSRWSHGPRAWWSRSSGSWSSRTRSAGSWRIRTVRTVWSAKVSPGHMAHSVSLFVCVCVCVCERANLMRSLSASYHNNNKNLHQGTEINWTLMNCQKNVLTCIIEVRSRVSKLASWKVFCCLQLIKQTKNSLDVECMCVWVDQVGVWWVKQVSKSHQPLHVGSVLCCVRRSWRLENWLMIVCSQPPQQYGAPQGWNAYGNQYQQQPSDPSEYRDRSDKQDVPTTGGWPVSSYVHVLVQTLTTYMHEVAYMRASAHAHLFTCSCIIYTWRWHKRKRKVVGLVKCSKPILESMWVKQFGLVEPIFTINCTQFLV